MKLSSARDADADLERLEVQQSAWTISDAISSADGFVDADPEGDFVIEFLLVIIRQSLFRNWYDQ